MLGDSAMRRILWCAAVFNLGGAALFAFPDSPLGRLAGMPVPVPGIYCAILAFLVALFGASYAWLALQPNIHKPLVALFALGKFGVFGIVLIFWIARAATGISVIAAGGDLVFAVLFAKWLWAKRDGT